MKIISSKGCPYGDRLRLMLNAGEKEYDISSDTNEYISGTFVEPSGSASADIFEIIDFLGLGTAESVGCTPEVNGTELQINYLFPQDEIKRNRHVKMAQNFDRGIIQYFNEASKDSINRTGPYHMFMEHMFGFENELTRCGIYFGGSNPGFLDFWIFPWINRVGIWTPEFLKNEMCRLQGWRKRMKQHELVLKDQQKPTRSDMLKYAKMLRNEGAESNLFKRLNSVGSNMSLGSVSE